MTESALLKLYYRVLVIIDALILVIQALSFVKRFSLLKYCFHGFIYINLIIVLRLSDLDVQNKTLGPIERSGIVSVYFATLLINLYIFILVLKKNTI